MIKLQLAKKKTKIKKTDDISVTKINNKTIVSFLTPLSIVHTISASAPLYLLT
jgi:hypothetical protein